MKIVTWVRPQKPPTSSVVNATPEMQGGGDNTQEQTTKLIRSSVVYPDINFVGRERELAEIHMILSGTPNKVFLVGIGGIGKSEIAKTYAKQHANDYDTVLWIPFEKNLLSTLINDNILTFPDLQRSNYPQESDDDYFETKIKHLQAITNKKTLLIIDNFDVSNDEKLKHICSGEYAIIFTTRNHNISSEIPEVNISELSNEQNLIDLFRIEYKRALNETELQAIRGIIDFYDKHTLSIRLIAGVMASQRITPSTMLEILHKNHEQTEREKRATNIVYERIKQVFHLSSLTEQEKALLLNLALVPRCGITSECLYELCEFDDYSIIDGLIEKSWVIQNAETDEVFLHTIIEELALELLKDSPQICSRMLDNLINRCKISFENMNSIYKERRFYSRLLESIVARLHCNHPLKKNMQFCYARFLYGNSMYYQSAQYFESLLKEELCNAERIHCHEKIIQCYILSGSIELAHNAMKKAQASVKTIIPDECSFQEGRYYTGLLHRCIEIQRALEDYDSSIEYSTQAKAFGKFYDLYEGDSLSWTEYHLGRTLMMKGDLDRSDYSLKKALDVFCQHNDQHAMACCYDMLALVRSKKGLFDDALELNRKACELLTAILIESHFDLANNQCWRGDIFVQMNNYQEAKRCYLNAIAICKDGNHTFYEQQVSDKLIALGD